LERARGRPIVVVGDRSDDAFVFGSKVGNYFILYSNKIFPFSFCYFFWMVSWLQWVSISFQYYMVA